MNTIYRYHRLPNGKERLIIKGFKTADAMYKFKNEGNVWESCATPYHGPARYTDLKPGTYAFAGGKYHNVKSLDASVLAHV